MSLLFSLYLLILDPLLSIAFTLFILVNVVKNLKATLVLFLQGSPEGSTQLKIKERLCDIPEVNNIHHMHFWSLDGESHVLTAHFTLDQDYDVNQLIQLKEKVAQSILEFNLSHTTIEFEFPNEVCRDKSKSHVH